MSTPLRYIYRGNSTQYNLNYPLNNGFQQLPYDDQTGGCGIPVGCPTKTGLSNFITPGDVLVADPPCIYTIIRWFNTLSTDSIGTGSTYVVQESDLGSYIYFKVTYPDTSVDESSSACFPVVTVSLLLNFFEIWNNSGSGVVALLPYPLYVAFDLYGNFYTEGWWRGGAGSGAITPPRGPVVSKVNKNRQLQWSYEYDIRNGHLTVPNFVTAQHCIVNDEIHCFMVRINSNYQITNIQRLILDSNSGSLKKIDELNYYNSNVTSNSNQGSLRVSKVETDGLGKYWLAAQMSDEFISGSSRYDQTGCLLCIEEKEDGSLSQIWSYELLGKQYSSPPNDKIASTNIQGFRLDLDNNIIYANPRQTGFYYRGITTVLSASTGSPVYKSPIITVNGSADLMNYVDAYIDEDLNIYQSFTNEYTSSVIDPTDSLWISKRDAGKNILWMKQYMNSINCNVLLTSGGSLLKVKDSLVFVYYRYQSGLPAAWYPRLLILDAETGNIQRSLEITTYNNQKESQHITVDPGLNPDEFVISITERAFYLTLNINNIPLNTTIPTVNPSQVYTFTELTINTPVSYTSSVNTTTPLPPDRTLPSVVIYSTAPLASGLVAPPTSPTLISGIALDTSYF